MLKALSEWWEIGGDEVEDIVAGSVCGDVVLKRIEGEFSWIQSG